MPHFDPKAPKKPTNVSRIAMAVREKAWRAWIEDNAVAIERYNDRIRARGVFSDGLRRF